MNARRTVTVPTIDHGPVTLTCPPWCTGHTSHPAEYRADLSHTGPEHVLPHDGEPLHIAQLVQFPYGTRPNTTGLYVEQSGYAQTLAPTGVDALAAALVEHAAQLRHLARELSALRAGERGN
ncbi:hypothetical protein [Streptomyces sp. CC210A]|uniref:DUF6907 domain-containing protein n=1 Tax=Streptomyces sp. CC210A TaxID=2898184 RepID=UPI001F2466BD|nr:hypothetical protein [Streptomyces sp. CC210A]